MPLPRIAIAQIAMHWTTTENLAAILKAMTVAQARGAQLCCFSELAVTGFHRRIAEEALPEIVEPALAAVQARARALSLAVSVGVPTFGATSIGEPGSGARFITQVLIDEHGERVAAISKQGLTDPDATVFARGRARPVGVVQGLRCSAVICREISDWTAIAPTLPPGTVDLIVVPGALRQDPDKPRSEPPPYVAEIQQLAVATRAFVVHTNWPNALNRPEESLEGGGSNVAAPDGELLLRLPMREAGLGIFTLGARSFEWVVEGR
jgi:predicted amidohydrolase